MDNFDTFYSTHINQLFTYCKYRVKQYQDAQDITADAFVRFMKAKGLSKPNPTAYLYVICKNLIVDYYRQHAHSSLTLDCVADQIADPSQPDQKLEYLETLKLLDQVPAFEKEVLLLRYVQDLDIPTIAHIIGKSEPATKSIIYRSLDRLRGTHVH